MTTFAISALPNLIVWQVVQYVCETKSKLDMEDGSKKPVNPLVALLHICHNWRQITLPMIFGTSSFCIEDDCRPHISNRRFRISIPNCINQSYTAYIQHLLIYVSMNKVASGESLRILTASKAGDFVFPSLKRVTFCIGQHQRNQLECPNANSNIHKLMQNICQMLPALELINLEYSISGIKMDICVNTHTHSRNLVDEFSNSLSVMYHKLNSLFDSESKCSLLIAGLTSLSISWNDNYSIVSNIIYANSPSLQKLYISYFTLEGIGELIHRNNSQQEYMCYPQLSDLTLSYSSLSENSLILPSGNAIVFPRLCKVDISFEYPFSDDVLFRGNQWSLESIDIYLSTQAMMQLILVGVFNKGNMVALKTVVISIRKETTNNAMLNSFSKNFFQGLLSSTLYLGINSQSCYDLLIGSINFKIQHYNLKCLNLGCRNVTFENIVVLLKALPRLSYLKSAISSLGAKYSGMTLPKILKHMQATFDPLSKFLNAWSIYSLESEAVDIVTTCIMLLIDQCPNFQTVVLYAQSYTTPIKIYEKLMRTSTRNSRFNARTIKNLQFKISFAPSNTILRIIRNPL